MDVERKIDRTKVEQNGWCQGAVCSVQTLRGCAESSEACKAFPESEGALAILISHDCDIVNDSLTREPSAYWLIARTVKNLDCVYLYGQNPRKLQFEHGGILYEVLACEFFSTPRGVLEKVPADHAKTLPSSLTEVAAEWLSKRFIRPAYPDTFNERIKKAKRQLKKALERDRDHEVFRSILIKVSPRREVLPQQNYSVAIAGVMKNADYSDAEKCRRGQKVIDELELSLADCKGIEVEECRLVSDEEVRLSWLDYYTPWDFEYLTFKDQDETES